MYVFKVFTVELYRSVRFILVSSLSLMLSIFVTGCSKDDDFKPVYNVPTEYQPFIDAFIREAGNRGYTLEIKNLIINFDATIEDASLCGL